MLTILLVSCGTHNQYYRNAIDEIIPSFEDGIDYRSTNFSSTKLSTKGLAFLPISAEKDVAVYKQMIGKTFNRKADSVFSNFIKMENVNKILKKEELIIRLRHEIESYNEVGVLRPSFLRKLSNLTNKEYFLFIELEPYLTEEELEGMQIIWETYDIETDLSSIKRLGASAIIWSSTEGTVVWEGFSNMYLFAEEYKDYRYAETVMTEKITNSLIKNISAR